MADFGERRLCTWTASDTFAFFDAEITCNISAFAQKAQQHRGNWDRNLIDKASL